MPADPTKLHADRIYLKRDYLENKPITDETKALFKKFVEKKVTSCVTEELTTLRTGLLYRLTTIEKEAEESRKERGDTVTLRQKLGHIQQLGDLIETVQREILLCENKKLADERKRLEEEAAAAAAAALSVPPPLDEMNNIKTLSQKFAILILHASNPQDEDRARLNKPSKNIIETLDNFPGLMEDSEHFNFFNRHNGDTWFLRELLHMVTQKKHDYFHSIEYPVLKVIMEHIDKETGYPYDKISSKTVIDGITRILKELIEVDKTAKDGQAALRESENRVQELEAQLAAAGATVAGAIKPEDIQRLRDELAAARLEHGRVAGELAARQGELEAAQGRITALGQASKAAAATAAATIARLEGELRVCRDSSQVLEGRAAAAEAQVRDIGRQLEEAEARAAAAAGDLAAARAAAAAAADGNLAAAEAAVARAAAEARAAADERAALQRQVGEANAAAAAARAELAAATERATRLEGELGELRVLMGRRGEELATARDSLAAAQASLATAQAALAAAQAERERIQGEKEAVEQRLAAGEIDARARAEEMARLTAEDQRQKAEIARLNEGVAAAAAALAAKEDEVARGKAAADELRGALREFTQRAESENTRLQEQINNLTRQLGAEKAEVAAAAATLLAERQQLQGEAEVTLTARLAAQRTANEAELTRVRADVTDATARLEAVMGQIGRLEAEKAQLTGQLETQTAAVASKKVEYDRSLASEKASCVARLAEARAEAERVREEAEARSRAAIDEAAAVAAAAAAELNRRIASLTQEVQAVKQAEAAKVVTAEAEKTRKIQEVEAAAATRTAQLEAAAAAAQAAQRQAEEAAKAAADKARADADAALAKHNSDLAAAVAAAKASCDEEKSRAAATAKAALNIVAGKFATLTTEIHTQQEVHRSDLARLTAAHKSELAAAREQAAEEIRATFAGKEKELTQSQQQRLTAELAVAKAASEAALAEQLRKVGNEMTAKTAQELATKQAVIDNLRAESEAALARVRKEAEDKSKTDAAAAKALLQGQIDAAVAAEVAKVTGELGARFEEEKKSLISRREAAAATEAAVAKTKEAHSTETSKAVAVARAQGRAAAEAADLARLKTFAASVLAGTAPVLDSSDKAKPLVNILRKLNAPQSSVCALVYFVSYFLNKMVRPKLEGRDVPNLIDRVKRVVERVGDTPQKLFQLIMAIEPALLLSNKVIPRGGESVGDTMNYVITQKTDTGLFQEVIRECRVLANDVAWRVVRGELGTATSMRFFVTGPKTVLFLYRPTVDRSANVQQVELRKKLVRTYSEGGVLSSIPAQAASAELQAIIENKDGGSGQAAEYVTYDILFLVFLYATKKYIVTKADDIPCTVPSEITNNSILASSLLEGLPSPAPAAPAPAAPAPVASSRAPATSQPKCSETRNIQRMYVNLDKNVILLSDDLMRIFSGEPYCFTTEGRPIESKVELSYTDFKAGLDDVVKKFCSGKNPTPFKIPPGFRRDGDKILPIDDRFAVSSTTRYDLISYTGQPAGPDFKCNRAAVSAGNVAVALQVPNLLGRAKDKRGTPAKPLAPSAEAEVNRLLAVAKASGPGLAARAHHAEVKAHANAAVKAAEVEAAAARAAAAEVPVVEAAPAAAKKEPEAWAKRGSGESSRTGEHLNVVDVNNQPESAVCSATPVPVATAVATPKALSNYTGVVLNTAVAAKLKAAPFCLNVTGYDSIKPGTKPGTTYIIYNINDLTRNINNKIGSMKTLLGFTIAQKTIRGKVMPDVTCKMANMFPKRDEGFYFLDAPNTTTERWGGRRTQKRRPKNSKKFTQRKR